MTNVVNNPIEEDGKSIELCESDQQFMLEEVSEVDDEHILARVVGESFFLNKASRNRRFYTESLWRKVLDESYVQQKFDDRLMYGTIGHGQILDDDAIREGKVSHIVSRMWIDDQTQKGMAEFLVLNTPTGRVLNTLLRAKSKLYTSTRAKGSFDKKRDSDGNQYVSESNFSFETIDFVYNPGFLQSRPDLVEELQDDLKHLEGIKAMADNKHDDLIAEEFRAQRKTIDDLQEQNSELRTERTTLSAKVEELTGKAAVAAQYEEFGTPAEVAEKLGKLAALEADNASLTESASIVEELKALGDVAEIKETLSTARKFVEDFGNFEDAGNLLNQYNAVVESLGTPEEIQAHLESHLKMVESGITDVDAAAAVARLMIEEFGSVEEAQAVLNKLNLFEAEAGSMDEALEAMRQADNFFQENSPQDLVNKANALDNFTEQYGSLEDASRALLMSHSYLKGIMEERADEARAKLAADLGVSEAKVKTMQERGFSDEEITEMFSDMASKEQVEESAPAGRKPGKVTGKNFLNEGKDEPNKDRPATLAEALGTQSRVSKLIRS